MPFFETARRELVGINFRADFLRSFIAKIFGVSRFTQLNARNITRRVALGSAPFLLIAVNARTAGWLDPARRLRIVKRLFLRRKEDENFTGN